MDANRRQLLKRAGMGLAGVAFGSVNGWGANRQDAKGSVGIKQGQKTYRAAIIGRTGHGDYGHGFDVIFRDIDQVSVVAIADENPEGLKKAVTRSGAKRAYRDYREMLAKEKLDILAIGPRHPDSHEAMALAGIQHGAHIYMEKPMTETVEQADAIVEAAHAKGVKFAVAHTRRVTSDFVKIKRLLAEGFIGEVRHMRAEGKQDRRAGGEDLIVLGTHDFDFMRYLFGDPLWCMASVSQDGRDIVKTDMGTGREPILVAGDTVRAMFGFANNIGATWYSVKRSDHWNSQFSKRQKWGFEVYGTRRIIGYQSGYGPAYLDSPFLMHPGDRGAWQELPEPQDWPPSEHELHPIRNLIHSIETDRQPLCSVTDGRWTIEMVSAVYESQRTRQRTTFPMQRRTNPLLAF